MEINKYKIHDIVFHSTPSGIKYLGIVKKIVYTGNCLDIAWFTIPGGKYFVDSPAAPDRVEWIGRMPEGAYWDGTL